MANKDFKVKNGLDISTPLPVSMGGTGQTSTTNTLNSLLPSQPGNASKVLQTDGTNTSWVTLPNGYLKGNTASRPGSPSLGDIYSNTQTGYIEVYTAAGWSQLGVIPLSATIGTATDVGTNVLYGSGSVDVAFTPNSGGGLASSFTAVSSPGSISSTNTTSPVRVTGLAQGTAYTFTVTATNGYGNALASSSSNSVTPTSVPQTPTIGTPTNVTGVAYGSTCSASIPVTANATGGKSITGFTITSSPGSFTATGSSPVTVSGLTSGTSYTFTATANNSNGNSTATSSSLSLTPSTVPQAPTIGTATAGSANSFQASVTFTPGATGGSAITSYTVTSSPGNITATGASSPITISGLSGNTPYTFTVTATNANGTSLPSDSSNSITPVALPTVSGGTLTSDATYYYRTFTSSGTLSVTNYQLSADVLVVGGGAGGGGSAYTPVMVCNNTIQVRQYQHGAGGGSGGLNYSSSTSFPVNSYSITVGGGGGAGASSNNGSSGTNSSINSITGATGTGGQFAGSGGSSGSPSSKTGGSGFVQYNGNVYCSQISDYITTDRHWYGGGGAGSGGNGGNATSGGNGSGGSGSSYFGTTYALGGPGGNATAGGSNTGTGGGGANGGSTASGANGGSGIVVVRYTRAQVGG